MRRGVLKGELCREFAVDSAREVDSGLIQLTEQKLSRVVIPIGAWPLRQGAPSCLPSGDALHQVRSR